MTDILQKIKNWEFTSKDSNVTLNLDYTEIAEIGDVCDRKIWFTDEVDENIINSVVYNILRYNTMDKDIPVEKRKPIIMYISSIGGDTVNGMAVVSAIQMSKTPIYTVNVGQCCSIAFVIYSWSQKILHA